MSAKNQTAKTASAKATTAKTAKSSTKKVVETPAPTARVVKKSKKNSLANAVTTYLTTLLGSVLSEGDLAKVVSTLEAHSSQLQKTINNRSNQDAKKMRVKDPNAPKRNKSSYLLFCEERREHIKKNNPDISATQIIRILGADWKTVSASDKARFEAMALKDKSRFEAEMKVYVPPTDLETRTKPKKAMNSYNFFYNETRRLVASENPALSTTEITREVGNRWQKLSETEKARYTKMASDAKLGHSTPVAVAQVAVAQSAPVVETKKAATKKGKK
jgi:hypothetical protein